MSMQDLFGITDMESNPIYRNIAILIIKSRLFNDRFGSGDKSKSGYRRCLYLIYQYVQSTHSLLTHASLYPIQFTKKKCNYIQIIEQNSEILISH